MIDLLKITHGGDHPVTYGDAEPSAESGEIIPKETVLTGKKDHGSLQRIDCMFNPPHIPGPLCCSAINFFRQISSSECVARG
jgi:hypothetical protein